MNILRRAGRFLHVDLGGAELVWKLEDAGSNVRSAG
jgi:hypothetical protein